MAAELLTKLVENPLVKMGDPLAVRTKLNGIINAGFDKLMVISDFDHTLSRHLKDGKRGKTTHGVFEMNEHPERYGYTKQLQEQLISTRDKYLKIEFCPTMTVEEKIPHMLNWWNDSHAKVVTSKFTRQNIQQITLDSKIELRDHASHFIKRVDACRVPLILFSAGIGDIIRFILLEELGNPLPESLHIVSNMMKFDEKDVCVAFNDPVIHTFNKNSTVIPHDAPFYSDIAGRTCVILLGDSLGDVHMDVGVVKESIVLRIGFLNFNADTLMERYLREFDIVLVDDASFNVPLAIFDSIHTEIKLDQECGELKTNSESKECENAAT